MAKKPLEQLSPAYRKRIENALAKGKTRQQARGHKAGESKIRREKELSRYGLTNSQTAQIKKFFAEVQARPDQAPLDYNRFISRWRGNYEDFKKYRAKVRQLHDEWEALPNNQKYIARGDGALILAAEPFERDNSLIGDFEPLDLRWFFYH